MAPPKIKRPYVPTIPTEDDVSDSESSQSQSDNDLNGTSDSDSDSLDSQTSRKRRKVAPIEDDAPPVVAAEAPSRFKAKIQNTAVEKKGAESGISVPVDHQTSFAALDVKPWLVGALEAMAIKRPTGIQKGCIPEILKGRDCIGGSRTGSGKTVAFAVPILQTWAEDPFGIFAVILTPTR